MTVIEAINRIRAVGELTVTAQGNIRFRVPAERREELAPAVALLRERKSEAMEAARTPTPADAALQFCSAAGARLVRGCRTCYPNTPAGAEYLVLVPAVNDDPEFRQALQVLRLDHLPVVPRTDPLGHLSARCEHRRTQIGTFAKQRNGPTAKIDLVFPSSHGRFEERAADGSSESAPEFPPGDTGHSGSPLLTDAYIAGLNVEARRTS